MGRARRAGQAGCVAHQPREPEPPAPGRSWTRRTGTRAQEQRGAQPTPRTRHQESRPSVEHVSRDSLAPAPHAAILPQAPPPRAPHHGPGWSVPSESCARDTEARGRRIKNVRAVQAISLCASTMNRMLAASRCRAYAPTKSGVFRGSAPCPCPPCQFLTCGSPDRSVATTWSKELSRYSGSRPLLRTTLNKSDARAPPS